MKHIRIRVRTQDLGLLHQDCVQAIQLLLVPGNPGGSFHTCQPGSNAAHVQIEEVQGAVLSVPGSRLRLDCKDRGTLSEAQDVLEQHRVCDSAERPSGGGTM